MSQRLETLSCQEHGPGSWLDGNERRRVKCERLPLSVSAVCPSGEPLVWSLRGRRVLHVLASNERRGAEVFATDLANDLDPLGWKSTLVALLRSTSDATVPATPMESRGSRRLLALRRLARRHDVVIAHGSTSLPACALACAGAVPFVYRSIGDPSYWSSDGLRRLRTKLLLDRAHTVVALFEGAAEELRRRSIRSDLQLIPNAVRAERFPPTTPEARGSARSSLGIDADSTVVLYLGALSGEKRPERALAVARARPDLTVLVVGDGPMRAGLERDVEALANAEVRGPTDTPDRYLAAADVVIVPSDTEGMPAVAIEAGLTGLPVVASDVGGLSAVIENGRSGVLIPAGDDHALIRGVDIALQRRSAMGAAARARCLERFDLGPVARQWSKVIERAAQPTIGT
jgi:glycosyltransferase involved in cell wall biosynthesis